MQRSACAVYPAQICSIINGRVKWDQKVLLCGGPDQMMVVYYREAAVNDGEVVEMAVKDHLQGPKHCKECPLYKE
jgi:hypothetical protein